jgi:hypothetical protein
MKLLDLQQRSEASRDLITVFKEVLLYLKKNQLEYEIRTKFKGSTPTCTVSIKDDVNNDLERINDIVMKHMKKHASYIDERSPGYIRWMTGSPSEGHATIYRELGYYQQDPEFEASILKLRWWK